MVAPQRRGRVPTISLVSQPGTDRAVTTVTKREESKLKLSLLGPGALAGACVEPAKINLARALSPAAAEFVLRSQSLSAALRIADLTTEN